MRMLGGLRSFRFRRLDDQRDKLDPNFQTIVLSPMAFEHDLCNLRLSLVTKKIEFLLCQQQSIIAKSCVTPYMIGRERSSPYAEVL